MNIRYKEPILELKEINYRPINFIDYLSNEKFHDSKKGCDIKMITKKSSDGKYVAVSRFCKTHNVICSKTGWELGWYMGTESKKTIQEFNCIICGKPIYSSNCNIRYCKECREKINKENISKWKKTHRNTNKGDKIDKKQPVDNLAIKTLDKQN